MGNLGVSETTANVYINVIGEKGETGIIWISNKTTLEVEFSTQNLGRLVTLTIGHDNTGFFPKWKVDNVDEFHHLLLIILIVLIILSRYIKWRVGTVWLVGSRRWLKVGNDAMSNG